LSAYVNITKWECLYGNEREISFLSWQRNINMGDMDHLMGEKKRKKERKKIEIY